MKNYAKVNLALDVVKKKSNNYHELDMVNISVSLCDVIHMKFHYNSNDIQIICNNKLVPTDEKNTVYRVIEKVKKQFHLSFGCIVKINKRIPIESGLAGGSGNAVSVLKILNSKYKLNMNYKQMMSFIEPISSDGPYVVLSSPSRVKGIGNEVKPIKCNMKCKVYLLKPKSGCSTKDVYKMSDSTIIKHPNINKVCTALDINDINLLAKHCNNSLFEAASSMNPDIKDCINLLKRCDFEVVGMSGSGSTCFAISKSSKPYAKAKRLINPSAFDIAGCYKILKSKMR